MALASRELQDFKLTMQGVDVCTVEVSLDMLVTVSHKILLRMRFPAFNHIVSKVVLFSCRCGRSLPEHIICRRLSCPTVRPASLKSDKTIASLLHNWWARDVVGKV